ncbi:flagellin [Brevibacillus laterosporus]|nr:flagellin [Brevibacillus laterosporus]
MICYLHVFHFLNHPFVQDDVVLLYFKVVSKWELL